ncbi:MAG: hypothetical protein ACP5N3_02850 [Candidatus Nanoarchaeia archaeon]
MVTVSHITKKILQEKPFIHEALEKGLINIMALSETLKPEIEKELGKVKSAAISMAIRRYVEESQQNYQKSKISFKSGLLVKSDLFEISLSKSDTVHKKLMKLYEVVDFSINDTLNIIHGNYEILIISNEKYRKKFLDILKGEKIKKTETGISSISMKIPEETKSVSGFYYAITKILAMENIPIIDLVNTENEATLLIKDKNVSKAYDSLKKEISIEHYRKK